MLFLQTERPKLPKEHNSLNGMQSMISYQEKQRQII
jgi:hypothetical protein